MTLPYLDAARVRDALSPETAVASLRQRLLTDPPSADRPSRSFVPVRRGELLVMPDESASAVGMKILSIARDNPARNLPAIQGIYLLMDAETLTPQALFDAAELTCVRTSAVSMLAVTHLNPPSRPQVVVVGTGPQALAHCHAAGLLEPSEVGVIARTRDHGDALVETARQRGLNVRRVEHSALAEADVIVCCTTAREPIISSKDVKDDVIIVAIGSHEPTARELATDLMDDAFVVVESRENARREAGDIIIAEHERGRDLIDATLDDLVRASTAPRSGRRIFKSVGDAWEDLTIAQAIVEDLR